MAEPFIGELKIFGGNFAPAGWMTCAGQPLPIAEYDALFHLIGTTYGGDGETTFALPDLRGRAALHQGSGYAIGQAAGSEAVTLSAAQIPSHTHTALGSNAEASNSAPSANALGAVGAEPLYGTPDNLAPTVNSVGSEGGGQPHDNMQPSLAIQWIIAVAGIFPSQG
jgi:microcystin-dependent protein